MRGACWRLVGLGPHFMFSNFEHIRPAPDLEADWPSNQLIGDYESAQSTPGRRNDFFYRDNQRMETRMFGMLDEKINDFLWLGFDVNFMLKGPLLHSFLAVAGM